ncbi:MAG: beta-lactamase family protein [Geobacteraceae bacterium]|nr:beta-lactamase family protein [Geobacteraceae bacterium]NTW79594.1 beta-lactamase family protein [Geobacteraceae bacterium]
MKFFIIIAAISLSFSTTLNAADDLMDVGRAVSIDVMLENAIRRGLISGGVVAVGNHTGQLYGTAQGRLYPDSSAPPLSDRTLFDTASLTKVIATAPAIMKLLEQGKINLLDPLTRWFPEFEGTDRDEITILNLLTHTSGMNDVEIASNDPLRSLIEKAIIQNHASLPGNRFRYADINFILLGELVRRAAQEPLDRFCTEYIYAPMGMAETGFLPQAELNTIAPTAGYNKTLTAGVVQDINARRFGGVAGHAGLFSTASDLNRFAIMILNHGKYNGVQAFTERAISQMTSPYFYSNGRVVRGLGWDINSPFSSPRGNYFSDMSFGHTGYSGSSIWIDPEQDLYVILLTVRLDYNGVRQFNQLRSDISSLAVSIFSTPRIAEEIINEMKIP